MRSLPLRIALSVVVGLGLLAPLASAAPEPEKQAWPEGALDRSPSPRGRDE